MSVSKWAYDPMTCDGGPCPGDCDFCSICYVDEYTGELHIYDRTLDAVIDFFNFFTTTGGQRK